MVTCGLLTNHRHGNHILVYEHIFPDFMGHFIDITVWILRKLALKIDALFCPQCAQMTGIFVFPRGCRGHWLVDVDPSFALGAPEIILYIVTIDGSFSFKKSHNRQSSVVTIEKKVILKKSQLSKLSLG